MGWMGRMAREKGEGRKTHRGGLLGAGGGDEARDLALLADDQLHQALAVLEGQPLEEWEAAVHPRDGAVGPALWR